MDKQTFKVDLPTLKKRNRRFCVFSILLSVFVFLVYIALPAFRHDWILIWFPAILLFYIALNNIGLKKRFEYSKRSELIFTENEIITSTPDHIGSVKYSEITKVKIIKKRGDVDKITLLSEFGVALVIKDWKGMSDMEKIISDNVKYRE